MATPFRKQFKVTDVSRRKTYLLLYEEYHRFVLKCKEKFGISENIKIYFVTEDSDDAEVEEEILEQIIPERSLLIMKQEEMRLDSLPKSQDSNDVTGEVEVAEQTLAETRKEIPLDHPRRQDLNDVTAEAKVTEQTSAEKRKEMPLDLQRRQDLNDVTADLEVTRQMLAETRKEMPLDHPRRQDWNDVTGEVEVEEQMLAETRKEIPLDHPRRQVSNDVTAEAKVTEQTSAETRKEMPLDLPRRQDLNDVTTDLEVTGQMLAETRKEMPLDHRRRQDSNDVKDDFGVLEQMLADTMKKLPLDYPRRQDSNDVTAELEVAGQMLAETREKLPLDHPRRQDDEKCQGETISEYEDEQAGQMLAETRKEMPLDHPRRQDKIIANLQSDESNDGNNFECREANQDDEKCQRGTISEYEDEQTVIDLKAHMAKFGLKNIGSVLKPNLDKWKTMPLNLAVTGASGKGKSSFINALIGLNETDIGAAEVGVKETTLSPSEYHHPDVDGYVIWDVPGVGTANFPQESYFEKIQIDKYDFFIVIYAERFTEVDSWLMKELKRRRPLQRRYIVRTKVDNDLRNEKRKYRKKDFDKMKIFMKLKDDFRREIVDSLAGDSDFSFFLISNHHKNIYDFCGLELQLLKEVPARKKDTMLFGIVVLSELVVKEKAKALRSRIWKIASCSGAGAVIPIPGVSTAIDVSLILEELQFYRNQFGLDDSSLDKVDKKFSAQELKGHLKLQTPFEQLTTMGVTQLLSKYLVKKVVEKVIYYTVPVIGSVVAGGLSYTATSSILHEMVTLMEADALKVLTFIGAVETCV